MLGWSAARRTAADLREAVDGSTRAANRAGGEAGVDKYGWRRDPKKFLLIIGLSFLAWISTATGMLELIQANLGEVSLIEKIAIGLAVAMLQIMIVWLLDQLFSPINIGIKTLYTVGYLFLTLISVGFAFGFYWKVLESRTEGTRAAESSVGQVQNALHAAETRLEQLQSTLVTLTTLSSEKAQQEAANGNSCPGSKPGQGPRMAMRRADAERFQFASTFVKGRVDQVKADVKALEADLQKIVKDDKSIVDKRTGTRNDFMRGMGRKLEETATRYNALRTDPQLRQVRADLAERAEKTTFPDTKGGTYACPDAQLQSALRGVVAAIDGLPTLEKPKVAVTEGSEAVIEAFRRLTTTLFGVMQFKMPPSPEELRDQQKKAVQSVEGGERAKLVNLDAAGLGKRDYIPLGIAIFVDFCILLVSIGRPVNRFVMAKHQMHEAEAGPVNQILGTFGEIHSDRVIRRDFEVFQHVIFSDWLGRYYVAVPLSTPKKDADGKPLDDDTRESLRNQSLMLANLFSGLEEGSIIAPRSLAALPVIGPLLQWSVRRRLRQQDSKFARARVFRVYKFKNRAWPEMILGAVMGAAKRHAAELEQKRALDYEIEAGERRAEADLRKASVDLKRREADLRRLEMVQRRALIERQIEQAKVAAAFERSAQPMPVPGPERAATVGGRMSRPFAVHEPYYEERRHGPPPTEDCNLSEALKVEVAPYVTQRADGRMAMNGHAPEALNGHALNGFAHALHHDRAGAAAQPMHGRQPGLHQSRPSELQEPWLEAEADREHERLARARSNPSRPAPPASAFREPANRNTAPADRLVAENSPFATEGLATQRSQLLAADESISIDRQTAGAALGIVRSVIEVNEALSGRLREKMSEIEEAGALRGTREAIDASLRLAPPVMSRSIVDANVVPLENAPALTEQARWSEVDQASWEAEQQAALASEPPAIEHVPPQEELLADPSTMAKRFAGRQK